MLVKIEMWHHWTTQTLTHTYTHPSTHNSRSRPGKINERAAMCWKSSPLECHEFVEVLVQNRSCWLWRTLSQGSRAGGELSPHVNSVDLVLDTESREPATFREENPKAKQSFPGVALEPKKRGREKRCSKRCDLPFSLHGC